MSKHKILFLDIDGVLNPQWWERKKPSDKYGVPFDPKTVACLEKIIVETGANIVISSSWKNMGLSVVQDMWRERGLPGKVMDITPDYFNESLLCSELNNDDALYERGCEIKGWLFLHKDEISQYIIVDDMDDILPEQQQRFVHIDPNTGMSEDDAEKAIAILNKE